MSKIRDQWNFLSKMDFRKIANAYRLSSSYLESKFRGKSFHRGMPISLSIEPTTSCNLRCPECPSGLRSFTRPTGMMEMGLYEKVLEELHPYLAYMIFYFQGEPYLHQDLFSMIHKAGEKGIYTATSTNGHYLNDEKARQTVESGLDRLIISIDGADQETYESYRVGGNLDKVLEGTRNIVRWKKELGRSTPHVIFQFLVVRPNEHQISDIRELAKSSGVDEVRFKTAQIYDYEHGSDLIPTLDKYSRYSRDENGTYSIKNTLENHCWKMWHSAVVTWDGKVVPCCFDKDAHHSMGELQQQSFGELWSGEAYHEFRSMLLRSRSEVEMCTNCTEGTKIWA